MGLRGGWFYCALLAGLLPGGAAAAPKLRLTQTAIGPLSAAVGAAAPVQTVDAYNAGDGELALDASTTAPWIRVSILEPRGCALAGGVCYPLRIEASAAGLEKGRHTGVVIIRAPGAVDAPQSVTVTLDAGGTVPENIRFAVKPGGADQVVIRTATPILATASTETGGNWLSIPTQGAGSFRFSTSNLVEAKHLPEMAEGEYSGRVVISGSQILEENRTVPVQLRVSSGPICAVSAERLHIRLAEGSAPYGQGIGVTNRGGGDLVLSQPAGSAPWISGEALEGQAGALLKIDPGGLAPGFYRGELEIRSNAANSPLKLEVHLEITPKAEPWMRPGSVSDRVTSEQPEAIAPGMLLAVRGEQLTHGGNASAPAGGPWPGELGGVKVLVNGAPAALESVTALEVRFQAPSSLSGEQEEAVLEIEREGVKGNQLALPLRPAVPRIERVTFEDGTPVTQDQPAKAGDRLLLMATGLGVTEPTVAAGEAAPPGARVVEEVTVRFTVSPFSPQIAAEGEAEADTGGPGRYRIRVTVPEGIAIVGFVTARVAAGGAVSNPVGIAVR